MINEKEPSKVLPYENLVENEAPKEQVPGQAIEPQEAPLTKEMFSAQMQRLTERAKAAGLNPIQTLAKTYVKQGMVIIEALLASLEEDRSKKKKE
jgi:hypothetical protein